MIMYIYRFKIWFNKCLEKNIYRLYRLKKKINLQGLIVLVGGQDCWCRYFAWTQIFSFAIKYLSFSFISSRVIQQGWFFVLDKRKKDGRRRTSPSSRSPAEWRIAAACANVLNLRISQMKAAPWCSKWTDGWDWVGPPGGVRYMRYRVQIIVCQWIHILQNMYRTLGIPRGYCGDQRGENKKAFLPLQLLNAFKCF